MKQEANRRILGQHPPKLVSEQEINKKLRKIKKKLDKLYPEYRREKVAMNYNKIDKLITKISKIEYKYIQCLKLKHNYK